MILGIFNFTSLFKDGNFYIYIVGLYTIVIYNLLNGLIFIILYNSVRTDKKPADCLIRIFKSMGFLTSTVFSIPILDYQLSIFICRYDNILGYSVLSSYSELK